MAGGKPRVQCFPMSIKEPEFDRIWGVVKVAIQECLEDNFNPSCSFEDSYRYVYTLTLYKYGSLLHDVLKDLLSNHLTEKVKPTIMKSIQDGDLLTVVPETWKRFEVSLIRIRDIFTFPERVTDEFQLKPVLSLGESLFKQQILLDEVIKKALETAMDGGDQSEIDKMNTALQGLKIEEN